MIKNYTFQVSSEEKNRILDLHEDATKRNYLKETYQGNKKFKTFLREDTQPSLTNNNIIYNISETFGSGEYKIKNKTVINNAISDFKKYYQSEPENYEIFIESSESKVPNEGVGLNTGDLSRLRGEMVEKYLNQLNLGLEIKLDDKGAQGPEWDDKKGSRWSEYTKYQYVYLGLRKKEVDKPPIRGPECLKGLTIQVDYIYKVSKVTHNCDLAKFIMTANGVRVKNVDPSKQDTIDLNNYVDGAVTGPNRYNTLKISDEDAKKILQNKKEIILSVYCVGGDETGCHSDPLLITITNGKGEIVMKQTNVTIGKRLKYREGVNIMKLDECGKVLDSQLQDSAELEDEKYKPYFKDNQPPFSLTADKKGNYKIEDLAQIYKYVDKQTKVLKIPSHFLRRRYSFFKSLNNKPWSNFVNRYSISEKQQKDIENYMNNNQGLFDTAKQEYEQSKKYLA